MRLDFLLYLVQNAIDALVVDVMPAGSCARGKRWLTFELEARGEDGASFRYNVRYSRAFNYVNWQVYLPDTEPHIRVAGSCDDRVYTETIWVPESKIGTDFFNCLERAPGYVIASGCHDSCWREHGMEMRGYPRVDTGRTWERTWNDGTKTIGKSFDQTTYFEWVKATEVRVLSVRIEGEINPHFQPRENISDGVWVNPDPENLTGVWALLQAQAALHHCSGSTGPLEVSLDTSYEYFRPTREKDAEGLRNRLTGLTRTKQKRETFSYRLSPKGLVIAEGEGGSRYSLKWEQVEAPYALTREIHLRKCGASANKLKAGLTGIHHMWRS